MTVSEKIIERIKSNCGRFYANDNISRYIKEGELDSLIDEVIFHADLLLRSLVIDVDSDHNSRGTAARIAIMFINEIFAGRYFPAPELTSFPNAKNLDQIYTIGPIKVRSTCSHHLAPITGKAYIGLYPSDNVLGLSKFSRIVNWVMSRPQIQEEATVQIANIIEREIKPNGLAIVISAKHHCVMSRGVKEHDTKMNTSIMRGLFLTNEAARKEFLSLIKL